MNRPWMPLYVADYRADTAHLNAAQHGAYLLLIMHYWQTGSLPAEDEQLARIACMTAAEWKRSRSIVVPFFSPDWKHKRIDAEIIKAELKHERRIEAGKRGGFAKATAKQNPSNAGSNALPSSSQPESERKKEPSLRSGPRTTGSRLPENWQPTNEEVAFALAAGLSSREVEIERDKFRDHWRSKAGKDGLKRDWSAAWRNWIRRSLEMNRGPPRGGLPRPGSREDRQEQTANAIAQLTDFITAGTDDQPGSGDAGEAPARLLPFAKSA